jgi:hypothetical protein
MHPRPKGVNEAPIRDNTAAKEIAIDPKKFDGLQTSMEEGI